MALYDFIQGALAWTVVLFALWPLNVPLAYLGYRIWSRNTPPPDTEWSEIWLRSTLVMLVLGLCGIAFVFVDWLLVAWTELPAGPIHLTLYVLLVALASWLLAQFYEIEDFFEAISLFTVVVYLPILILWPLNWLLGFMNPLLGFVNAWLVRPQV